ncbi:MAG: NUDIX hydrolase [Chitinophagales bacterium]|nr:NUDIX hydrolase [Chitinophagales bacterium]
MLQINKFNVRVYGILFNANGKILVEDTIIRGHNYTKLPGGGLEFGESTHDCLIREFKEETDIDIEVSDHFYTTDIFQPSAFDDCSQVISIYYFIESQNLHKLESSGKKFDLDTMNGIISSFRWVHPENLLRENYFTLPLDRIVGSMLIDYKKSDIYAK